MSRKNINRFLDGMSPEDLQGLLVAMLERMTDDQVNAMLWDSLSDLHIGQLDAQFLEARKLRYPMRRKEP